MDDSKGGIRVEAKILVVDDALDSWTLLSSILQTHRDQIGTIQEVLRKQA
jgi:hypothetical protein